MHAPSSRRALTVVAVSDAVLQHCEPLLLLLLRHHAEVVVAAVRVPQDEGERGGKPNKGAAGHLGLHTCSQSQHWVSVFRRLDQRVQSFHI